MLFSFEALAVFWISAVLSFLISGAVLLMVVAKSGLLRIGHKNKLQSNVMLLPPGTKPKPLTTEMTPLAVPST